MARETIESEKNTEKYRRYFDILRRNDAPMANNFPSLESFAKGLPTHKWVDAPAGGFRESVFVENKEDALREFRRYIKGIVEGWIVIKNIYDGIILDEQDENTGRLILQENKALINKFHILFMQAVEAVLENPESPPNIPKELFDLRSRILENAIKYGGLPAVRTYNEVGREGTLGTSVKTRDQWFDAGKPTNKEWFEKWFGRKM